MPRIPLRRFFPNPLGDSPRKSRESRIDFDDFLIFLMILPGSLAVFISLILAHLEGVSESPKNRQIILDVPETSRVDAQVTSENNTVNLQNL